VNPLVLVVAHLRRSWAGALALTLVVAVAIAIGVGVLAQERALRQGSARAADPFDLVIGAPGSPTQLVLSTVYLQEAALPLLPPEILAEVGRRNGIAWYAPLAFGDTWKGHPVIGTTEAFVRLGGKRALAQGRMFATPDEAVIGADISLALGDTFEPSHGHSGPRAGEEGHRHEGAGHMVVGRLPRTGTPYDGALLVPVESVWQLHGLPSGHPDGDARIGQPWTETTGGVPAIVVKAASVSDAYRLRGQNRGPDRTGVFPAEVLVSLYATLGDIRDVMQALTTATQALVLVAVLVAVMAATAGRRREIAVLRALGASRLFVFSTIWIGIGIVLLTGGTLGLLLGYCATWITSSALGARYGIALPVQFAAEDVWLAIVVVGIGLVFAVLPAGMAWRQHVAAGLR
jgi:putative ABC transport system permease protein